MTIRDWIHQREIQGIVTFTTEDVSKAFPKFSPQQVHNNLYRACKANIITQPYRGFYVTIPPHYAAKGIVPPVYYIDQLMTHLHKQYYVSLLSAAEFLGAAHQRPQYFCVMTTLPQLHIQKQSTLDWTYRSSINTSLLQSRNSETSTVLFSGPELTALDLVQYEQHIGGLSRAATIIEELSEQTNWKGAVQNGLIAQTTLATVQRLGYILEHVLHNREQADTLYTELRKVAPKLNRFPLSSRKDTAVTEIDKRWSILINIKIEIDEL
ncbi:MAG: type IV toxin-antitoxin system AbiEi family antitoxin [Bacteroidales bacterium]|nr:type IV toxin-antitoxin system AbiEi family antitoxin [Bacteroidales bacterium]